MTKLSRMAINPTGGGIRPEFTIGDRLRKARNLLGDSMDVARFAQLIGTSKGTITNYELERTAPDRMKPIVLRQWAMATGVDYAWLIGAPTGGGDGWAPRGSNPRPADYRVGGSVITLGRRERVGVAA